MGKRVFISYKRGVDPDETVALRLFESLKPIADPFIDQTIPIGELWANRIEEELRKADFLVVFLSGQSVHSEMVLGEVETAHQLMKNSGRPKILPVRLAYREPFQYPMSAYLNSIQWALWESTNDTNRVLAEICQGIQGGDLGVRTQQEREQIVQSAQPPALRPPSARAQLETPEGTMDPDSEFYIEREGDSVACQTICRQGVTVTIKGSRQMGKSSLLVRTLRAIGHKQSVFLDFQLFDHQAMTDQEMFYRQFCSWWTEELGVEDKVEEFFDSPLSLSQRCTRYVQRHLLRSVDAPLVLAMDEVDSLLETSFSTDFFSMLRSWHNARATSAAWKRLDLALVISTEPYQLIDDLNQSPFNVGQVVELEDFDAAQVSALNDRHGTPLGQPDLSRFFNLLGGHPFLTRRGLYLIASGQDTPDQLFAEALDDRGPFGDHLRHHMFRLQRKPELMECFRAIIETGQCRDEMRLFRLRGAGLVRRQGGVVVPRCKLYADYFRDRLHV